MTARPGLDPTVGLRAFAVFLCVGVLAPSAARGAGRVVGWGDNQNGEAAPPPSVNGTAGKASAIAAGLGHSCAIQAGTGAVVCWGWNYYGQAMPPAAVNGTAGTATALSAGSVHNCAVQSGTGAVVCWGAGSAPPPSVDGASGSAAAISAGTAAPTVEDVHDCAIQAGTGAVVCWGFNNYGQATPPPSVDGTSGTATAIAAGGLHSCAIRAGTSAVVCWGSNVMPYGEAGELPIGQATPPPAVDGSAGTATAIAAGPYYTCAIQAGSGAVVCWGVFGSSGPGDTPTPPPSVNGTVGTASAIAAGSTHTCAIQSGTRRVVCWGDNAYSQATPPPSVDGTDGTASAIAAGHVHTLAIRRPRGCGLGSELALALLLLGIARRRSLQRSVAR